MKGRRVYWTAEGEDREGEVVDVAYDQVVQEFFVLIELSDGTLVDRQATLVATLPQPTRKSS